MALRLVRPAARIVGTGSANSTEEREQRRRISLRRVGWLGGVGVGVAVDPAVAERDGQEAPAAPEPDRPRRELGETVDEEPPAGLPQEVGLATAAGGGPDPRAHAVSADDEAVVAAAPVVEGRRGRAVLLTQPDDRRRQAHGDALAQHLVELATPERDAGAGRAPEPGQVDVEEQAAALVQEPLPRDLHGRGRRPSPAGRAGRVPGRSWPAGTSRRPDASRLGRALDDVALDALPDAALARWRDRRSHRRPRGPGRDASAVTS